MKKTLLLAFLAIALTIFSVSALAFATEYITGYDVNNNNAPVKVEKGTYYPGISLTPGSPNPDKVGYVSTIDTASTATTSPILLEPIVSSTTDSNWHVSYDLRANTEDISGTDNPKLNLMFTASTTLSKLNWAYYFSDNAVDWYTEDYSSYSSLVYTHASTTLTHSWTPNTTSRQFKHVDLPDFNAKWIKVTFNVTTASGSLYANLTR